MSSHLDNIEGSPLKFRIKQKKSFLDRNNHHNKNYNIFEGPHFIRNEYTPD